MKNMHWVLALTLGSFVAACDRMYDTHASESVPATTVTDADDEFEEMVSLDEVPAAALQAALAAVEGFVPSEAEKEIEGEALLYCIHGHVGEEFVEVEVTPGGEVLEVERGDDDDDDDEDEHEGPDDDR